jgi:hypothetical protein
MPKLALFDVIAPENTVTAAVPAEAIRFPGTEAVSWPLFTNVVVSAEPFQRTEAPETNPLPLTVSAKAGPPAATLAGASDEMVTAPGAACVTGIDRFDTSPYVVKAPDKARGPGLAPAVMFTVWLPVRSSVGADIQLGASRNQ